MSMIEFQVSTSAFLAAQRTALGSLPLCPPRPIAVGTVDVVIDQIEFGNNAIRHGVPTDFAILYNSLTTNAPGIDVEGYQTQIAQDVTVHVTTLGEVLSRPNQAPAASIALHGTLVFNLDFYALETECYLRTELVRLDPAPLPSLPAGWPAVNISALAAQVQQVLRTLIPTRTVPAGLSALAALWAKFENAGVSVDGALQRIAFRAQIGGSHDGVVVQWRNFLQGYVSDRLGGSDWAFFIDSGLITEMVKARVNAALADVDVDNLQLFVGCAYSNAGGKAAFTLDVEAVYDLPGHVATISRDPSITMELSVSMANTLRLLVDYSSVLAVIHSIDIVELILPSLSDGIEGMLQHQIDRVLVDLSDADDPPYCHKLSTAIIECTKTIQAPRITSGVEATMVGLLALNDGIAFVGTMRSRALTPAVLATSVSKFAWTPPRVSCGQSSSTTVEDVRQNAAARSLLRAEVRLEHTGTTPVFVCGAPTVMNTNFPPTAIQLDRSLLPAQIVITMSDPGAPFFAAPTSLDLLIATTAGLRLVRVPPPPQLTPEIIKFLGDSVEVQLLICDKVLGPWFDGVRPFDVSWIVDPLIDPPREVGFEHLWRIDITGAAAGQRVSLADRAGQEITHAVAQAATPLRLTAVVAPAPERELTAALRTGRDRQPSIVASPDHSLPQRDAAQAAPALVKPRAKPDGRGIEIRQQRLSHARSIPLPGLCRRLLLSRLQGIPRVFAILRDEVVAFSLENPHLPAREGSWTVRGMRGACRWPEGVLIFGDAGFSVIKGGPAVTVIGPECDSDLVVDVTNGPGVVYVLRAERLEVRSMRLCTISALAVTDRRVMARVGRHLVLGGRKGLDVYDTSADQKLALTASRDDLEVSGIFPSPDAPSESVVATLEDGSARVLSLRGGHLHETAVYARCPWFVESLRLGNLLLRIATDRRHVTVDVLGESRLVVPAQRRVDG